MHGVLSGVEFSVVADCYIITDSCVDTARTHTYIDMYIYTHSHYYTKKKAFVISLVLVLVFIRLFA